MFSVALSLLSCEVLPVGKHMLVRASSCWIMLFRLLIICSRCSLDSLVDNIFSVVVWIV